MDAIFLVLIIAVIVAGIATFLYLWSARGKRETGRLVVNSPLPAVKLKPPIEASPVARTAPAPAPAAAPAPPAPPLFDLELEPSFTGPAAAEIRWSKQFDSRSETLDETSRLRLIGDLGVVGKEWCVPLLAAAYEEERRPGHRQAALIALTACHSRAAAATFRNALQSNDPSERAIAADGLADLEPPPQSPSKRTVERR